MGGGAGTGASPIDALKLELELANAQTRTPEEARKARGKNAWEALSMTPGPGNVISGMDAKDAYGAALEAAKGGDLKGAGINAGLGTLSALGAVTGLPVGPVARAATKGAKDRLNVFVGPEARTADRAALAKAEELRAKGADRDTIWRDTGWAWDERGKPYFEIDDSTARLRNLKTPQKVDEFLDHPALFAARPDIAKHDLGYNAPVEGASYHPPGVLFPEGKINVGSAAPSQRLSNMLHEAQHAADNGRGASAGANIRWTDDADDAIALERVRAVHGPLYDNERDAKTLLDMVSRRSSPQSPEYQNAARAWSDAYDALQASVKKTGFPASPGHLAYTLNPGEVRARNVEARRTFTAADRRESPPWHTIDVDEADIMPGKGNSEFSQVFIPVEKGSKKADRAGDMRAEGRENREIWDETRGVYEPGGQLLEEVPANTMRLKRQHLKPGDQTELGKFVEHPALFDRFPQYRHVPVKLTSEMQHTGATGGGAPIFRTTPAGGYEVSLAPGGDTRNGIDKLLQYSINDTARLPVALRHGPQALPDAVNDTVAALQGVNPPDRATSDALKAYLDKITGERDTYMHELATSTKKPAQIETRAANRNAGNMLSRIVRGRAGLSDDALRTYPYARGASYMPTNPASRIAKWDEAFALPPPNATPAELEEFIRLWRETGTGKR